ncbi:MAG: CDP-alcohol phosphatidyltransferase family protein [Candidatus Heimdallarchaeota archaeon]|nr:CDP-alcohol phosphatidyltransferase family protein [Candidatus Heimdallarchaeota archaeon]
MNSIKPTSERKKAKKSVENIIGTYFYRPISFFFTKLFILLRFKPNGVTFLSYLFQLGGALFFLFQIPHYIWLSILFIQIGIICDYSDGEVARLTNTRSKKGAWMDPVFDRIGDFTIYLCIGIGSFYNSNDVLSLIFSFVAMGSIMISDYIIIKYDQVFRGDYLSIVQKMNSTKMGAISNIFTFYSGESMLIILCIGIAIQQVLITLIIITCISVPYFITRFLLYFIRKEVVIPEVNQETDVKV